MAVRHIVQSFLQALFRRLIRTAFVWLIRKLSPNTLMTRLLRHRCCLRMQECARAREISRFHDTRLEPLLRGCFAHVAPQSRDLTVVTGHFNLFQERLTHLARIVEPSPLLFGDQLTIADCGFVPSFVLMHRFSEVFELQLSIPQALVNYEAALAAHPSVSAHSAAYYTTVDAWIASKLG